MVTHVDYRRYITSDPSICHGALCFKGTRIMVYLVLELLEAGETEEQILQAYPNLTREHIQAALHLAAELIERRETLPLPQPS